MIYVNINVNLTILRKYTGNSGVCASSGYQAVFSPPTRPGNEARIVYLTWQDFTSIEVTENLPS